MSFWTSPKTARPNYICLLVANQPSDSLTQKYSCQRRNFVYDYGSHIDIGDEVSTCETFDCWFNERVDNASVFKGRK